MNFKLAVSALVLGCAFVAINGCSAEADAFDEGDAEEAATSQDEMIAAARKLTGAFHFGEGSGAPTSFTGLVLNSDGTFFGDADTGIRCITAPCPSSVRLEGTYAATRSYVRFTARPGAPTEHAAPFYGRFKYTASADGLVLSRAKSGKVPAWSQSLAKETSYCAEPTDCALQGLMHPMCVGTWTCGAGESANTCGYHCGVTPPNASIWPASATKLVAESKGGGFTPVAPSGSTCNYGQQKLTLDRATRDLTAEVCTPGGTGKPLTLKATHRTLTAAQLATVEAALGEATIATGDMCGADKPLLQVVVSLPTGDKTYTDSFYSCQGGGRTYLDGIDGIFGALRDLP